MVVCCLAFTFLSCEQPNGPIDSPVVLIGDSIFALSGEIKNELERLTGEKYRSYCVSGSEMDGGGNDIQVGGVAVCGASYNGVSTACKRELQKALDAADNLFTRMRSDGVENIIYMNFFYIQNAGSKNAFDWMHDQMADLVRKHNGILVEPDPTANFNNRLIGPDNIHPTREGSRLLAKWIYETMKKYNVDMTGGGSGGTGGCGF